MINAVPSAAPGSLAKNACQDRWLGRQGSNLRMAASKAAALPLGDAPAEREALGADGAGEKGQATLFTPNRHFQSMRSTQP